MTTAPDETRLPPVDDGTDAGSPVEVALLDVDGVIVAVNDAWTAFCLANDGDPVTCGVGADYLAACDNDPDPVSQRVGASIRAVLRGQAVTPAVVTVPCPGPGGERWFDIAITARPADDATLLGAAVVVWPVEKPPDQALLDLWPADLANPDSGVWQLIEAGPDGTLLVGGDGRIRFANRQLLVLSGRTEDELIGQPVELLIDPAVSTKHQAWRRGFHRAPRVREMGSGVDTELRRADGALLPVEIRLAPIRAGDETLVMASVRDISRQREDDRSRRRLLRLLDLDPDAVFVVDAGTAEIEYANTGASRLLGYDRHELLGMTLDEVTEPAAQNPSLQQVPGGPGNGSDQVHRLEVVRRTKVGTAIPCDSRSQRVRASDGEKLIVVDRDARERLAVEAIRGRQAELAVRIAAITQLVLSDSDIEKVYSAAVEAVASLLDAENASLVAYGNGEQVTTLAAVGPAAGLHLRGEVQLDVATLLSWDGEQTAFALETPPRAMPSAIRDKVGPGAVTRFHGPPGEDGVLTAFRAPGREPFTPTDVQLLADAARQVSLVLELGRARSGQERLEVLEERQRIARDLHDIVIQDLIGLGMELATPDPSGGGISPERAEGFVDQLERAIQHLRMVVFDAWTPTQAHTITAAVRETVEEARRSLGHEPTLTISGLVDELAALPVGEHIVPVVREALSNVARHAQATATEVDLRVEAGEVVVRVDDNGHGLDPDRKAGTGMRNLRERAGLVQGSSTLTARPGGGAHFVWTAPVAP